MKSFAVCPPPLLDAKMFVPLNVKMFAPPLCVKDVCPPSLLCVRNVCTPLSCVKEMFVPRGQTKRYRQTDRQTNEALYIYIDV